MATMMDYIQEEQATLVKILQEFVPKKEEKRAAIEHLLILATGSSSNACLAAKYAMEKLAGITVTIEEPYHFNHYGHLSKEIETVLAVSQSGKSTSTIDAVAHLSEQGFYTISLSSDSQSLLAQKANERIDLGTGIETVGFVTKGYVATVLQLYLMGVSIGYSKGILSDEQVSMTKNQLEEMIEAIPQVIAKTIDFFEKNASIFKLANRFVAVGYGPNWGTAKEFETKFTETIRVPSQGFELEAYMHGPYLEANHQHVLFFIEAPSSNQSRAQLLHDYIESHVGKAYTITTAVAKNPDTLGLDVACEETFSSLLLVIPFQIFSYLGAGAKGIDLNNRIFDDFDQVLKSKI
ncbi:MULTISPECIES: SIS domain-containing protein [Enterococcus]|uniref:Glucosamine--fructose-6-phosphate aminotransferase n=1 Tax=Enterococcus mundtii TaxID=53346 RepID=A0A1L8V112_ENTMU|nr:MULTISPECIES: SIS domain-containing protein [Enterococcus]GEN18355.1 glucosamine--fructose-6-phosphate aminotransferase [Ligilactobacillus acidipiscis]AUB53629.1 glucosamine-fructose-6-phosphate aminotransferase [Enterococcus mundtii]MDB7087239.1 SIS domain-containing protein [Enterococcus mundtii]MZZ59043.1 SIS domain-containing protein [Enterococcus mundtii]MZZ61974.1 SIS domain-containing protein [Enterococcus mundtii]